MSWALAEQAGDLKARDHMAVRQGSVSLDKINSLMAAMDPEDYRDGSVDLSQLLGLCRSARDGFMTASASKDPTIARSARRNMEESIRLSVAVWTNVLDNNRRHISGGLAAMSDPSADTKVKAIKPDYGGLKMYPEAIAGLAADIAEAERLGVAGLKRQAERTRDTAIAKYVEFIEAVADRARRDRSHRISVKFFGYAIQMYRKLGMKAEAYDKAVFVLAQKAEAEFPDDVAAAYKIAVATETLKSFRKNVTNGEIFQECMQALNTLRSALDIARDKLKDPRRASELEQKTIVRLRELTTMSFETINKFRDIAIKIADGRVPHANSKESRHVLYLHAVDGVKFVSEFARAMGVKDKLPYDPTEKYENEKAMAERLRGKLDHGSTNSP